MEENMERREFIKQAALTAATVASASPLHGSPKTPSNPIARRTLGKTGEKLSIIGFGGIVVMDEDTGASANIVPRRSIAASIISTWRPATAMPRSASVRPWRLIARTVS
jgi:hypothetical protein